MRNVKSDTALQYQKRLLLVLMHIQDHLDQVLSLDRLADVAAFSPFHFHRIFRTLIGETLHQHVQRLRLERAAQRLMHSDRPILEIALECGYDSHEAFSRTFKSRFGLPPSRFRAEKRKSPRLSAPTNVHYGAEIDAFRPVEPPASERNVRIADRPPLRVAFVRHIGPYDACGTAYETLMRWAAKHGVATRAPTILGVPYDDPAITPPDRLRYDACVVLRRKEQVEFEPSGPVGIREIPGGPHAVVVHIGPFSRLDRTYDWLFGHWLPGSGHEAGTDPCHEVYHDDPALVAEEKLRTEIFLPLELRGTPGSASG